RAKLKCRAAASKARNACSGGKPAMLDPLPRRKAAAEHPPRSSEARPRFSLSLRERVGVRAAVKGRLRLVGIQPTYSSDHRQHAIEVLVHLVVPKSNNPPAARLQPNSSPVIADLRRRVLTAVELDNEGVVGANEVSNEIAEGHLTAEFQPQQAAIAQPRPEALFDISLVCAQTTRRCGGHAPA